MLAQSCLVASGSIVLSNGSKVGFPKKITLRILSDEQFWGRAVRASCDPLDPGRFLFGDEFCGRRFAPRQRRLNSFLSDSLTSAVNRLLKNPDQHPAPKRSS